eukprot:4045860-Alexandrium_andersonii.AAC.1
MEKAIEAEGNFRRWFEKARPPLVSDEEEMITVSEDLDNACNKWRAFEDKGDKQGKYIATADYDDSWFAAEDSEFNVFYVCNAGAKGD